MVRFLKRFLNKQREIHDFFYVFWGVFTLYVRYLCELIFLLSFFRNRCLTDTFLFSRTLSTFLRYLWVVLGYSGACYLGVQEQVRKRVGFTGGVQTADDATRPNRLHRRDTPHHLKNKRINAAIDRDKVASIIAQVSFLSVTFFLMWMCCVCVLVLCFPFCRGLIPKLGGCTIFWTSCSAGAKTRRCPGILIVDIEKLSNF